MTFIDVETARKTYYEKFKKDLLISAVITLIFGVVFSILIPFFGVVVAIIVFGMSYIFTSYFTNQYRVAYRKAYKGYFIEQNLKKIFKNVIYDHEKGFSSAVVRESRMVQLADKFASNDLTLAKYKNIAFAQADVAIIRVHTDSDGHTHEYAIFKGRYMIFEFPKKFDYRLEIIGKKFKAYSIPGKIDNRKMVKLETESVEFNRNFKIFGQDGFESFYLLDPAVIAKIEDIAVHYDHKLLLGFYDNRLVVALDDGKDSFEPPKFTQPIDEKTEMQKVYTDIKVITDFVDIIAKG